MDKPSKMLLCRVLILLLLFTGGLVSGNERAQEIIQHVEDLYRGTSSRARTTMTVETPQYQRTLTMDSVTMGAEKILIRILEPKKDRGITTLKQDAEMWNFFPKINKVIKVPPSMMMASWMGSDFTNDDIVRDTDLIKEYDFTLTETESTYEIGLTPKQQTVTVWGRIDYVIDKEKLLPITQTYYDESGEKIRVMSFSKVRVFGNRSVPSVLEMAPLNKPGYRTVITFEELELDAEDVDSNLFTLRNLKKRF